MSLGVVSHAERYNQENRQDAAGAGKSLSAQPRSRGTWAPPQAKYAALVSDSEMALENRVPTRGLQCGFDQLCMLYPEYR
ncbi:MAG TPA: hypothetical protein VHB73_05200 [Alphaproteobacteria bacterium]|nr:hypothetical protein [Alphaproteobacteria bacterium]